MNNMCPKILPCILEALGKKEKLAENYEILRSEVQEMVKNETNTDLNEPQNAFDKAIATGRNMGILRIKNDCISIPVKISSSVQRKYYKALRLEQHNETLTQPTAPEQETSDPEANDGNLKRQLTQQSVSSLRNRSRSRSSVGIQLGQGGSLTGLTKDINAFQAVEVAATPNPISSLSNLAQKQPLSILTPIQKHINKNEKMSSELGDAPSKSRNNRSRSRISFATYESRQGGSRSRLTKDINVFQSVEAAHTKLNERESVSLSNLEEKTALPISASIQRTINGDESLSSTIFELPTISQSYSSVAKRSARGRGRGRRRGGAARGRRGRSSRSGRPK